MLRFRVLLSAVVFLFFCRMLPAQTIEVNEKALRLDLREKGSQLIFPVRNPLPETVRSHLRLEVLDSNGKVRGQTGAKEDISPGASRVVVPFSLWGRMIVAENREIVWDRLRYTFEFEDQKLLPVSGVAALEEITPELFELKSWRPESAIDDSIYRVRIRTQHPMTRRGVGGVLIVGKLEFDDDQHTVLEARAVTNGRGDALLEFSIPANPAADSPTLKVTATRAGLRREISSDIDLFNFGNARINTDKPIYQPGQILHMRALLISEKGRAQADTGAVLTVSDPENTMVYHETLKSSRFGIVHADWQIPDNQRLGDYKIKVTGVTGEDSHRWQAEEKVKISRYELPNFAVNVKPDRPYYLPGQNAQVEVRGDYLFGKAVTHGQVRVVREQDRHWNYDTQEWEIDEGAETKGQLDANGRFTAQIDLKEEEENFWDDDYARFRDLRFAAYVTDATTHRTEQRRFDVRITQHPIHVYFIPNGDQKEGFPLYFYVSAQYADGSPCECEVRIHRDSESDADDGPQRHVSLIKLHTNRYGLARVSGLQLPPAGENESQRGLVLEARDRQGRSGRRKEGIDFREREVIRILTDKTLYREGEPINIEVQSTLRTSSLVLDVLSEAKLVTTEVLDVRGGRAWLTIPYSAQFQDGVGIVAYDLKEANSDYWSLSFGSRVVLYPRKHQLNLNVRLEKTTFRPGEDAGADFHLQGPNGENMEGALGVVITDQAVDARARTEQEFNSGRDPWTSYSSWWAEEDIAGVRRSDLDKIDLSEPVPADLDLVAEVLLRNRWVGEFRPRVEVSGEMDESGASVFQSEIHAALSGATSALQRRFLTDRTYPRDEKTFTRLVEEAGIRREALLDPWGIAYRTRFYFDRDEQKMAFVSAGPDKVFNTPDDFECEPLAWNYFTGQGEAIDKAVAGYHQRTGKFIRDETTLKSELSSRGIDSKMMKDRWGLPYLLGFGTQGRFYTISITSEGPGRTDHAQHGEREGAFILWTTRQDFLAELEAQVRGAIADYYHKTSSLPQDESSLEKALLSAGLDLHGESMRDPWGNQYYPVFEDRITYSGPGAVREAATTRYTGVRLRSSGPNKVKGDYDDFDLAEFSITTRQSAVSRPSAERPWPQPIRYVVMFGDERGAITGKVTDPTGAVIPNATVTATSEQTGVTQSVATNNQGEFVFSPLAPGSYSVRCEVTGFRTLERKNIKVRGNEIVTINLMLEVGAVSETIEVEAASATVETTTSSMAQVVKSSALHSRNAANFVSMNLGIMAPPLVSTPRLREYFPETLLWQPELITDKHGHSHVKFKLADNITSWKLSVLASNEKGEIGSAQKEFTAFQPFFADLDPPPVLTQNDEISLPVVLRNYLGKAQLVKADMKPESWFTLLGPASQQAEVPAGDSKNIIFPFQAIAAVHEGKQRVTAIGSDASDAIERKVSVHPDGEEQVITQGQIFSSHAEFRPTFPDAAIPKSAHAELKIYPNLMAHVMESIEGSLERPYGCGEQTISSTYPNLLVLRAYKAQGIEGPNAKLALRYLQTGYNRLLSYRSSEGGFTYWGKGEPDLALTAYALQFLNDARNFIAVDGDTISGAQKWLFEQQTNDGRWAPASPSDNHGYASWHELSTTSYITRVIAETLSEEEKKQAPSATNATGRVHAALAWLAPQVQKTDEPYFVANYALAALVMGEHDAAAASQQRLESLAHESKGEAYWELERNTPFYGWGIAGRVETTALALRALALYNDRAQELELGGLRFLLREKDRYGVWYSGQATVSVVKALIEQTDAPGAMNQGENPAEIRVNGKTAKRVTIPAGKQIAAPIIVDLSEFLAAGENQVELTSASEAARSSAQLVATYYLPWNTPGAAKTGGEVDEKPGDSDILHLSVHYDKTEAKIGDEIHCHVEVERIGFHGYGMMLAEIGLPPAADVDRESLDKALANGRWSLDHYDVLPDRLIAYVWPRYQGGATKFEFAFRPRMGEVALSAPSSLYDYYNPEAHAVVAPTRFSVH